MKRIKEVTAMWSLETQVTSRGGQALKRRYKLPFQQATAPVLASGHDLEKADEENPVKGRTHER